MNEQYYMVRAFHEKFGAPIAEAPSQLPPERVAARGKWIQEELDEFYAAGNIYEQADAMLDLIYFALGSLVEMGLEPDPLFAIVQKANMAKLWPDGLAHFNADGKVIKSPQWTDPEPQMRKVIDGLKGD